MVKILKNNTISDIFITDVGINIVASSSYTITEQEYLFWAASTDIEAHVVAGDIIVNDGITDLSNTGGLTSPALNFLKYPDFAKNQRFQSEPERSNVMTAKTTQEAIEESRLDIEKESVPVLSDINILNFDDDNFSVTANPITKKVDVKVRSVGSDSLVSIECLIDPECGIVPLDIHQLVDSEICFLTWEDC